MWRAALSATLSRGVRNRKEDPSDDEGREEKAEVEVSWFTEVRALAELKKQRLALERIATSLEELLLRQADGGRAVGIRTFYKDTSDAEGEVLFQDDAAYAEIERLELAKERAGGVGVVDEEIEE